MRKKHTLVTYLNSLINPEDTVLDLGCGSKVLIYFINGKKTTLDIWKKFNPDILWNLNKLPLPFGNNSFDNILIIDAIEHLEKDKGIQLLEEAKRIVKKQIFIFTPLFWTDNHKNIDDSSSPYYQNIYNKHLSLWTRNDFKDWTELKNIELIQDMYFGVWKK